jgi:hypothetical protein
MKLMAERSLFHVNPYEAILICDEGNVTRDNIHAVANAIRQWGNTIGRGSSLRIESRCERHGEGDALIRMSVGMGVDPCPTWASGCTSTAAVKDFHLKFANASIASRWDVILHEAGHMWGNCDRYDPNNLSDSSPFASPNCDFASTGSSAPSAMQSAAKNHPLRVTEDDAEGMRLMARHFGNSAAWASFLGMPSTQIH